MSSERDEAGKKADSKRTETGKAETHKPETSKADEVARTREEFAATLDAIEDRINPKTQLRRAKRRFSNDPKVLAAAAAGAAGLAFAVTGVARMVARARR